MFCDYAGPNTILWETPAVYVVEPLRQVTPGHLLVIPRQHAEDFADDPAVTAAVFRGAAEYAQANGLEDATSSRHAGRTRVNGEARTVQILNGTWTKRSGCRGITPQSPSRRTTSIVGTPRARRNDESYDAALRGRRGLSGSR